MKLGKNDASLLVQSVRDELDAMGSRLDAVLQAAGCERKLEGTLQCAVTRWLDLKGRTQRHLCLTQHHGADLVIVDAKTVGRHLMKVNTVFEVKFNYASQLGEIRKRAPEMRAKAYQYAKGFRCWPDAYGIYLVANRREKFANLAQPHDKGLDYNNGTYIKRQQKLQQARCILKELPYLACDMLPHDSWELDCYVIGPDRHMGASGAGLTGVSN